MTSNTKIYSVPDMSCQHCVDAITEAVTSLDGVDDVAVDLAAKSVTVTASSGAGDDLVTDAALVAAIDDAGFDAVSLG